MSTPDQAENLPPLLLQYLHVGVVIHAPDTRITLANEQACQFLGLALDQILGKAALDPAWCFTGEDGAALPLAAYPVNQVLATRRPLRDLVVGVRRPTTNDTVWGLANAFPEFAAEGQLLRIVVTFVDITARKRAEHALRESEERFRTLVDSAPDGIFVQSNGRCLFVNPAMVALLGASGASDLLGSETRRWVAPDYHEVVHQRIALLELTGGPVLPAEQVYLRVDGSRVVVETTAVAMKFQGRDACLVFVRDSTTRKRADAERAALHSQLQHAQKMESVGRLAGGIAHDFNNILMVQRGYCELLRAKLSPSDPIAEGLDRIDACAEKAGALTRQLLTFSRKQPLQLRLFDINGLVSDLSDMLRRLMNEDVALIITLPAGVMQIKADPGQIEQVLFNLAVNARDAMPQGGTLRIEVVPVEIDETYAEYHLDVVPGPYVMLVVSDTGCGMDQATMSRIFEPFFTTKGEGQGTGLGLSTVYGIVHQSGGQIWVYSEVGVGTTFKVYLPRHDDPLLRRPAQESALIRGASQLILVVEDEPGLRDLLKLLIADLGYCAHAAANGGAALILIEEEGMQPDLLITDMTMPSMSGQMLVERLRRTLPFLPVIYMSGYTSDTMVQHKGPEAGANYLQKPFSKADLAAAINVTLTG
ncbi:MAG: PAS domain S-box protein [Oscillochloris sp.]|nr:PAS domain S-box protein [Oscillochloris sp.]